MRLVAVTEESSLAAALHMLSGWDVVFAPPTEEALRIAADASVVLIGVGDTDAGIELAERLRLANVAAPAVVVGDRAEPPRPGLRVVTPPFGLHELREAIDEAARSRAFDAAAAPEPEPEEPEALEELEEQEGQEDQEEEEPEQIDLDARVEGLVPEELTVIPGDGGFRRSGEAAEEPAADEIEPEAEAEPEAVGRTAPPPPAAPVDRPAPQPAARAPRRRFLRRGTEAPPSAPAPSDAPILARLRAAAEGLRAIDEALEELPMLADPEVMAQGVMREVLDLIFPEIASILVRTDDGFRVFASEGLSRNERTMVVPLDQALIRQLEEKRESILIDPVELAQGFVVGIPGARSKALIAAPIVLEDVAIGVILVARTRLGDDELDALDALASEAALGLGVSWMIDRLRAL